MTNSQCTELALCLPSRFKETAAFYGFEVEGPSARGSFLVREPEGKTWLFAGDHNRGYFGRMVVASVWSPLNVAVMRQESTEGL